MIPRLVSIAALALVALTGCYKINYTSGGPASLAPPTRVEWHHRLVYGLVELEPVSVAEVCPGGTFTQAHTEVSLPNGIVQMIVGVIYTPSTIQIWCASGAYYEGTLNESGEVVQLLAPVGEPLTPEVEAARDAHAQRVLLGG
ncbi:Bor family protein [Myxococcota bacterium]|nr:Bor family protein [Myxococcota bacterium]